jgi:hypothetical protein
MHHTPTSLPFKSSGGAPAAPGRGPAPDFLSREDLAGRLDDDALDHLFGSTYWTGNGGRPVLEAVCLDDLLGLLAYEGGAS